MTSSIRNINRAIALAVVGLGVFVGSVAGAEPVDFNRDIRGILADKCFACHGPDDGTRKAKLRFDLEDGVFKQDDPVIVRGKPAESELIRRILSDDADEQMPPPKSNKSLSVKEKELLKRWIAEGAKWKTHWAYVPPKRTPTPKNKSKTVVNEIDAFIQRRLNDGQPSQRADKITLIRRLYFDLIGLPPTPAQVDAFVNDKSDKAYTKVVDELLKSPHFGERMAIYWLDVVRYADSNGYHADAARQSAPFRDYVIDSFNNNKPYDQFIVEQLAGDLMPNPTIEQKVASGFNMLLQTTTEGGAQAKEYIAKYAADRVRNTSQIFLGSTMGCSECHNHKFDPFTTKDFYSFAAYFADIKQAPIGGLPTYPVMRDKEAEQIAKHDVEIAAIQKTLDTQTPELTAAQNKWESGVAAQVSQSVQLGPWFVIGPFKGASFDDAHGKAFLDPTKVDTAQAVGKLKWKVSKQFVDGKVHTLVGGNSAYYLLRTVEVAAATQLGLSLGSDDSIQVWVNGQQRHNNKISRGVLPDQDKLTVDLKAGKNELLMKITNGAGGFGFYFKTNKSGIPGNIATILKLAKDKRSDAQNVALAKYFRSITPALADARKSFAGVQATRAAYVKNLPRTIMTVIGTPRTTRILPRGNWLDESGLVVNPAIPEFLGKIETGERRGNRLDLAKWIARKDNPLTARTFVNRLWKLFLGQGLATPLDDFGRQGTLPTHPELLDWMSVEFMESGWDVNHMIRKIVHSHTYQQSSMTTAQARKSDPYNQLYSRQTRFRLDAESVRDNALAISGLLVRKVGGRSVFPYQPAGYWRHMNFPARTWKADKGEDAYRRGLYTWWQRMFLHPSMLAFDAPSREECTVERPRSNIPQQALVLLNDPTYVESARAFAIRIVKEGGTSFDERLNWAYRQAVSREVKDKEASILKSVYDKHLKTWTKDVAAAQAFLKVGYLTAPKEVSAPELAAWTSVARIILNLHETITRS
jgi:mono/diheme cytochrome c family protein